MTFSFEKRKVNESDECVLESASQQDDIYFLGWKDKIIYVITMC